MPSKLTLSLLLALAVAALTSTALWQKLSAEKAEAEKLRSTVQALQDSVVRSTRAYAELQRRRKVSEERARQATLALDRALAAQPDWAATPLPPEVRDAL